MFLQIGVEPSRIDILMGIDGLDFTECWERRTEAALDDMKIHFISIQDLLANKERVGRPQDLIDAENLRNSLE